MREKCTILIAEIDEKTRNLLSAFLTYQGHKVVINDNAIHIFDQLADKSINVLIAGTTYLKSVASIFKEQNSLFNQLLVVIGYGDSSLLESKNKFGNSLFMLSEPLNFDEMDSLVMRVHELQSIKTVDATANKLINNKILSSTMIGSSQPMRSLFDMISKVAASNATVLIQGESGTGKELAARAIHQLSTRNSNKFVPVNCAAIPDDLLESELFGHIKGSFTGAYNNRVGRFEMADKGTLFLDEIGDMKAHLQVKLLRVLQNREFEPVGSSKSQKVDVRIVAASNKKLEDMVANNDFREDLYYRLSVIPITIPPLRERKEDIPLLISSFLKCFQEGRTDSITGFSKKSISILANYDWPGNVRELENLVERLVILKGSGIIEPEDLPEKYLSGSDFSFDADLNAKFDGNRLPASGICLNSAVFEFEYNLISQALERTGGNKKEAARLLNLKRTTLIEKLKKKNIAYGEEL